MSTTATATFGAKIIRSIGGGGVQLISYALAGIVFVAVFFSAALILDTPFVLLALSVIAAAIIGLLVSYLAARIFRLSNPGRYALFQSLLAAALIFGLTAVFVLRPLIPKAEQYKPDHPNGVVFWELPTGSTLAVRKIESNAASPLNPIVFLHGGPGAYGVSLEPTVEVISQLSADGHDVYFYDQVGGGLSQRLSDISQYSINRHLKDLEAIYQKIGADKIILIGSSWGSSLAANYIARYPSHVSHAIFSGSAPIFHPDWKDEGDGGLDENMTPAQKKMFSSMIEKPRLIAAITLAEINPIAAARFASDAELGALFDQVANAFYLRLAVCDENNIKAQSNGYGFWSNRMTGKTLWDRSDDPKPSLRKNDTPVLILRGECDYKKEAVARQYAAVFPNATYIAFEDAGHMLYWEKPDEYLLAVRDLLNSKPE